MVQGVLELRTLTRRYRLLGLSQLVKVSQSLLWKLILDWNIIPSPQKQQEVQKTVYTRKEVLLNQLRGNIPFLRMQTLISSLFLDIYKTKPP